MAKIVLATFGSLGDLHPKISLGIELKRRGHDATIAAMEFYRPKIEMIGLGFSPMAPHIEPGDEQLAKDLMDTHKGSETVIRRLVLPNLKPMYEDLLLAVNGADILVTGEIVYAARAVVEKTGIKWASTSVSPIALFSAYDPPVPPPAVWFENFRFLGPSFHRVLFKVISLPMRSWLEPYREFRRDLGLNEDEDPIMRDKFSNDLHLVMFSRVLGAPQPDWPASAVQTGFCFYDGQDDDGQIQKDLEDFLGSGEPPIVFTLGSAAVMDARDFFDESAKAAAKLGRRAVLLYGRDNPPPKGLSDSIVGYEYAPYSRVFPSAACVVHQGGVGTTGQVLRAGVPHLIMPYGHDQPDNAARCRRAGVGEMISRNSYNSESAVEMLGKILSNPEYSSNARRLAEIVNSEGGSAAACDAIEHVLSASQEQVN
jgi:rhamnosyltransferase subunit B